MRILMCGVLALAGCAAGTTIPESPHAICGQGQLSNGKFSGVVCPTIAREGETPMGSRINADGSEEDMYSTITGDNSTGRAAVILAETKRLEQLLLVCAVAPGSAVCG